MTEEKIKEMLNGIINNGEKWEGRCLKQECCSDCNYSCVENKIWQSYKLGEEILDDWEYRQVYFVSKTVTGVYILSPLEPTTNQIVYKGSEDECRIWIKKEEAKKTWLEESMETQGCRPFLPSCSDYEKKKICFKNGAIEVCKKILEEAENRHKVFGIAYNWELVKIRLEEIIKDLGVEI